MPYKDTNKFRESCVTQGRHFRLVDVFDMETSANFSVIEDFIVNGETN